MAQFALPFGPSVRHAARSLDIPYVVQLRGDDVWVWPHRDAWSRTGFVESIRDSALVLAVSRALIDEAQRLVGGKLPPAAVVPNGIDLDRFRPPASVADRNAARAAAGVASDELMILCVGDAIVRKGWLELLDALAGLPDDVGRVVLVGAANSLLRELDILVEAERRGCRARIDVLYDVRGAKMISLYQAADIFCLASQWEGISNAVLEALATGIPVITSALSGNQEVISSGAEGLLVPPRDVNALRDGLYELLTSPALRQRFGLAARRRALAIGDSRAAGRRLDALLREIRPGKLETRLLMENPYRPIGQHTSTTDIDSQR